MTRLTTLAFGLALLAVMPAQSQGIFQISPPQDFLESRVSYANNANDEHTAAEFITDISERLSGCEQYWYAEETALVLECLAATERDDVLLQFQLEWYPNQGVSRMYVFEGFSGQQYDSVRDVLDMLPRTAAELEEQAEIEARFQRLQELWANEYSDGRADQDEACIAAANEAGDYEEASRISSMLGSVRLDMRGLNPGTLPIFDSAYWRFYRDQGWIPSVA